MTARSRAFPPRLPYPPLAWRILRTTALVWAAFHLGLAFVGTPVPHPVSGALIVGTCAAAIWLDLRRHHELLFFANLGVSPAATAAVAVAAAGVLEVVFQLTARLLLATGDAPLLG